MDLKAPIEDAGFIYKVKKKQLEKLGILTKQDLLYYAPYRYEEYSDPIAIQNILPDEEVVIQGKVAKIENQYTRNRFALQKAIVWDDTGEIECIWFNQTYLTRVIHEGDILRIVGKTKILGRKRSIQVKDYEVIKDSPPLHITHIVPVYSETRGLSSKWIRNRIAETLRSGIEIEELLPDALIKKNNLIPLSQAIHTIHFPNKMSDIELARNRLSFDELILKQLAAQQRKETWMSQHTAHTFNTEEFTKKTNDLIKSLPFELTNGQREAIDKIFEDVVKDKPMNRLLEGDVGSGKTIVATVAIYLAYLNGYQSAIMAPTGILAEQHFKTISALLSQLGVNVKLFTSSTKETKTARQSFDVAVGTHALIHKKVDFQKLGLIVIDEQQRFGVEQRAILREKGTTPHVLTMTATPIPRTILLAAYGDLDVSILNTLPTGRKKIRTWLVPAEKRTSAYEWIKEQIRKGGQVFIVCPFIEPSESMETVKAAKDEYVRLKEEIFTGQKLALLHGKMKAGEKNKILEDFKDKKYDILVTTPVVEVGIDIPEATIMIIEAAERFGLSQLHQLRGRVGRNDRQSYCLLFSDNLSTNSERRLKSLETVFSGPELAEIDLSLRGPGNIYGTAQHGRLEFRFASFQDKELLEIVKREAKILYPELENHELLRDAVKSTIIQKVSPD